MMKIFSCFLTEGKITAEHEAVIRRGINTLFAKYPGEIARLQSKAQGSSANNKEMLLRWDILWSARKVDKELDTLMSNSGPIYKYANDNHIDTVLRKLMADKDAFPHR